MMIDEPNSQVNKHAMIPVYVSMEPQGNQKQLNQTGG